MVSLMTALPEKQVLDRQVLVRVVISTHHVVEASHLAGISGESVSAATSGRGTLTSTVW